MTAYLTCRGCIHAKTKCEHRDAMRDRLKGLSVTSLKWKCSARAPLFVPGDPVWADTCAGDEEYGDGPAIDNFPAVIIRMAGTKALVYIAPQVESRDLEYKFHPRGNGFCKITLSRITPRDAPRELLCEHCELPASHGHQSGYSCAYDPMAGDAA